jgi:hypothetical protein
MSYYPPPTPEQKRQMDEQTKQFSAHFEFMKGLMERKASGTLTDQDQLDLIRYSQDVIKWHQYDDKLLAIKQFEQACADRSAARLKDPNWDIQRGNMKDGS